MSSIPAGRREVNVRGDGNCFYKAMALAVMEFSTFEEGFEGLVLRDNLLLAPKY